LSIDVFKLDIYLKSSSADQFVVMMLQKDGAHSVCIRKVYYLKFGIFIINQERIIKKNQSPIFILAIGFFYVK